LTENARKIPAPLRAVWDVFTSLKLTIACLAGLMVLVMACTLAQVSLGTWGAVAAYMRPWIVWWHLPASTIVLPVFPGGALIGAVLMVNLALTGLRYLEPKRRKIGLMLVHAGLVVFFVGEFVSAIYQVDTRLAVEIGQTVNFVESPRENELTITDVSDPATDEVFGLPEQLLARADTIAVPGTPLTIKVKRYFQNAELTNRAPTDPPSPATIGVGTQVTVREQPPVSNDDHQNTVTAYVEPVAGGTSYGTWLVSNVLGSPQSFTHEGRTYTMALRPRRWYLPYSVTLKEFRHEVYPGTDIPKNFASLVQLRDPGAKQDREVLIYMNQPLRYAGRTFYQASFGKQDTLSILQVVENPGWLMPYIACGLVTIGLLIHFGIALRRALRKRAALTEATT
jgi:hypothetical protein